MGIFGKKKSELAGVSVERVVQSMNALGHQCQPDREGWHVAHVDGIPILIGEKTNCVVLRSMFRQDVDADDALVWAMSFNNEELWPVVSINDSEDDVVAVLEHRILTDIGWSDEQITADVHLGVESIRKVFLG